MGDFSWGEGGGGACNLYTGYSDSGVWPEKKIRRGRSIFRGRWGKPKTRRKTSRGGGGGEKRTNHRTRTQALLVVRDSVLSPVHQSCSSRKREKTNSFPNVLPINQSMSFLPFQPDIAPFSKSVKGVWTRRFMGQTAMLCWWTLIRAKQMSMAATARVIWLCACVRYWLDRHDVGLCWCFTCSKVCLHLLARLGYS